MSADDIRNFDHRFAEVLELFIYTYHNHFYIFPSWKILGIIIYSS